MGTICRFWLTPLPSTLTLPVLALTGTITLRVVPLLVIDPVTVTVPIWPLASSAVNCTRVSAVKPWPVNTRVWPVLAEAWPGSAAWPRAALALRPVTATTGWAPQFAALLLSSAQPPSVMMRMGPSRLPGVTTVV